MVSNATCWSLIIAGLIMMIVAGVVAYGGLPSIPGVIITIAIIIFWIGVICFILGIVLLIVNFIRLKTG